MNNSTPSRGRRQAALSTLKEVDILNPQRAREIRAEWRARDAEDYYRKTGFISPGEYIAAGCPELPLDYCAISARTRKLSGKPAVGTGVLRCFENDLEVRTVGAKRPKQGNKRGVIVGQSDRSIARLTRFLNRLRWPDGTCYFVGLTFPDEFPEPRQAKLYLRALLKRLARRFPDLANLWRQEWKRRKSGQHAGEIAPHFHLFLWGVTSDLDEFRSWLAATWTEIAGAADPEKHLLHGSDVKVVISRKQACHYVSKYMAKSENDAEIEGGRAWGHSSNLDSSPLWVIRLTQAELALLRKLAVAWAWAECQAIPSILEFIGRLLTFPAWMGWHMYGVGDVAARSMLERVLQQAGDMGRQRQVMEGIA